jgi:diguanylate cyclase
LWETISSGQSWHGEKCNRAKDGTLYWINTIIAPLKDTRGKIERYISIASDITQRKLAETALTEERQYLASVIEGTRAGTWRWNVSTGQTQINDYWAEMLGYSLKELGEQNLETWAALAHPEDMALCSAAQQAHFSGMTDTYEVEFRMRHKAGHWVWILSRGRVLTWTEDSLPEWMFGTHSDITGRKQQEEALREANEKVYIATKSGGIGIWSYDVINDFLACDITINALYGLAEDEALTLERWASMLHPDDREDTVLAFQDAIAGNSAYDVEFRAIWRDGSVHYIRAKASLTRDQDGKALHMLGTNWDVTALRELTLEVAKQHETLRVTLQSIGDAVITTDAQGRVTWLNPAAERMTGWLTSEAKGKPLVQVFNIVNEVTRKAAENPVSECLRHGKIVGLANHTILISRDGIEYGIEDSASPIRSANGKIIGVVLVFHDVTEQRRLSSEMSYRATHDSLTGLVNRSEFETRLTRVLNHAKAEGSMHALMFIDLDQFKLVNDACGHSAGDILLQQVSKMLFEIVRSRDTLARLGGDEFGVILEQCTTEQAQRVAQTICDRMDEYRFIHDGKRFRIGTSIGLSVLDGRWASIANVIQAADTACYTAKEAGRNRVHTWFDTDASVQAHQGEMQWATRLEIAMDENQFELYAQRIFLLDQESLLQAESKIHAEILLRLRAPNGEIISPNAFLPAAERFHLASRIDRWVLEHVIEWLKSLQDISVVSTICVNLSGQSIGDRAFHGHTIETLMMAGKQLCERICLEITETATVTNMADASIFIEQVRQLGVRIALDDFGAGASSFGYLKTLKVDMLKIDGQFIKAMIHDPLDDSAVRCFVDVASIVGLKTVAEYVESPEILAHVRSLGINCAQGYLMHKPTPIHGLIKASTVI